GAILTKDGLKGCHQIAIPQTSKLCVSFLTAVSTSVGPNQTFAQPVQSLTKMVQAGAHSREVGGHFGAHLSQALAIFARHHAHSISREGNDSHRAELDRCRSDDQNR